MLLGCGSPATPRVAFARRANLQYYDPAFAIIAEFGKKDEVSLARRLVPRFELYFKERQDGFASIAQTIIPVVVYQGDALNLNEIFKRINSQGTPLNEYEVYSAAWPTDRSYKIDNSDVIDAVVRKYDSMERADFDIYGYDPKQIKKTYTLTAFEYLFGLSKVLTRSVDILKFIGSKEGDDDVNALGFELVDACLNDTNRISELYKNLAALGDINAFEKALLSAIDFVRQAVSPIVKFKGNTRLHDKILHSKFQIMSMISTTFKEMYLDGDYSHQAPEWFAKKDRLAENLMRYYVYDILTNYWGEGGTGKIYAVARPNRYATDISGRSWATALNGYFELSLQKCESKSVRNPGKEEYAFLACIYLHTFKAIDQLSADRFDIEHLAPKAQLKNLIDACNGQGLPIGCVANLCYLPEYDNRTKGARTIYQDKKYLDSIDISEVEAKYSFTKADDLYWLEMPFDGEDDFLDLKKCYEEFLRNRFAVLEAKFCESLGIKLEEDDAEVKLLADVEKAPRKMPRERRVSQHAEFIEKVIDRYRSLRPELELKRRGKNSVIDKNGVGYVFVHSKPYERKDGKVYWYAYRPEAFDDLKGVSEICICYIFADDLRVVTVPRKFILDRLDSMPKSEHEDGTAHWHIKIKVFSSSGAVKLLSGPQRNHLYTVLENVI